MTIPSVKLAATQPFGGPMKAIKEVAFLGDFMLLQASYDAVAKGHPIKASLSTVSPTGTLPLVNLISTTLYEGELGQISSSLIGGAVSGTTTQNVILALVQCVTRGLTTVNLRVDFSRGVSSGIAFVIDIS